MTDILSKVNHPQDLKTLSLEELEQLGEEIRQRVLEVVDRNGGHLASNLGSVELTLALHKVFDVPNDRLVWDTSHQTYPHKLVTGRKDRFELIRTYGGICGFASHRESIFDLFDAGHAGTACSLALGVSTADRLQGRSEYKTIAVVGDSAAAAGMTFEALNHGGENRQNMLVILNDNNMSINKAVGALSKYLTKIRTKPAYQDIKRELRTALSRIPVVGKHLEEVLGEVHDRFRDHLLPGTLFRELGYRYYGPADGHDLANLIQTLEDLKNIREPVLLHLNTKKGRGFEAAEDDPVKYHALKDFLPKKPGKKETESNGQPSSKKRPGYSSVFKEAIVDFGRKDRRICAITAGMPDGTGLLKFAEEFPDRYFDVGICEQHGAGFASGLAFGGMRPVFAIYSTFSQRAYDQLIHDVCIQENSVVFCLDRAGLTGEDGWTHHGVYDIAFMRCVPGMMLMAPRDGEELRKMLRLAIDQTTTPVAIRYPKASVPEFSVAREQQLRIGKAEVMVEGEGVALFAYGSMVEPAWAALEELAQNGIKATLVNARFAKPLDIELLESLCENHHTLVTLEEHVLMGGFGSAVTETLADKNIDYDRILRFGVPDDFITFGPRAQLLKDCGLSPAVIARRIIGECRGAKPPKTRESRILST